MENDCDEKLCGDCCVLFSDRDEDSVWHLRTSSSYPGTCVCVCVCARMGASVCVCVCVCVTCVCTPGTAEFEQQFSFFLIFFTRVCFLKEPPKCF